MEWARKVKIQQASQDDDQQNQKLKNNLET